LSNTLNTGRSLFIPRDVFEQRPESLGQETFVAKVGRQRQVGVTIHQGERAGMGK